MPQADHLWRLCDHGRTADGQKPEGLCHCFLVGLKLQTEAFVAYVDFGSLLPFSSPGSSMFALNMAVLFLLLVVAGNSEIHCRPCANTVLVATS